VTRRRAAAALALLCAAPLGGCAAKDAAKEPAAPPPAPVIVETREGARHRVEVELARTDAERARGLMNRPSLPPERGMLFLFAESEDRSFWMKNTLIPLDMLFVAEDGTIAGIVESATPLSTSLRGVGSPSRYVLEVNGGWSRARGVRAGDRVRFENVPRF
jgi:uncharacterized membrane protein (UPF0127 family)